MNVEVQRWRSIVRVELLHQHHRAAEEVGELGEAAGRRVVERPGDQVHVGLGQPERLHEPADHGRIHAAPQRPLRPPRRAARVDYRAAERLHRILGGRRRVARREQLVDVRGPGPPLAPHEDPAAHLARAGSHPLRRAEKRVADDDRPRVGVVEDVRDFVGDEPVIHGHGDRADRARRRGTEHGLEPVLEVDNHVLALRHAERA